MHRLVFFCFVLFGFNCSADFTQVTRKLAESIRASSVQSSELGVWVGWVDPAFKDSVYELGADRPMIPASVTKLLTASAALEKYKPNHQFETQLVLKNQPNGTIVSDDLYLIGGGDPTFTSELMYLLVNDFQRSGIKKIIGDIIIDDTRFDSVRFDPSREPDRVDQPYDAPVGAMSFNWNTANIFVRALEIGKPAKVIVDPENSYVRIDNQARTVAGSGSSISVHRLGVFTNINGEPEDVMQVRGTIGADHDEVAAYRNISQPEYWSGYVLKAFLAQRGITVTGTVKSGVAPSRRYVVAKTLGKTLNHVVADLLKFSNNFVAEMLTKNMAADYRRIPGQMDDGMAVIKDFLVSIGFSREDFQLINPSGLTRRNKFRARDIGKLLGHLRSQYQNFPELLSAAPIAGVDGTLKNRMQGTAAEGWVRAKTGTLTGVAGLAGYAFRPIDGKAFEFAFFFNGAPGRLTAARQLFDRMAQILVATPVGFSELPHLKLSESAGKQAVGL